MILFPIRRQVFTVLIAAILFAFGVAQSHAQTKSVMSPEEKKSIEGVVRDLLMKNPEIIIEAIQSMREREQREGEQRAKANLVKFQKELLNDPDTPVGANVKGDVTIVEFFDYRCGYCKRAFPDLQKIISSDKNIRFVYKEFPILGPDSMTASKAGLAAWAVDKTKYEAFHRLMMDSKGGLPESRVMEFATKAGYDAKALKKAMANPKIDELIARNFELAKALDINGTPAFIIGDEVIRGAVDLQALRAVISKARGS
ncbi:MAG: DsbA family protein [Proteobacteria bacterium]|nr:DsbA family protein [Pseudomonadota bacterium]